MTITPAYINHKTFIAREKGRNHGCGPILFCSKITAELNQIFGPNCI
jgi:hypothetical protein